MSKRFLLIITFVVSVILFATVSLEIIRNIALAIAIVFLIYQLYLDFYFNSKGFKLIKDNIKEHTIKCNDLNHHIEELKCSYLKIKSYDYGESFMQDNSNYNFKRTEWSREYKNHQTHNCSATVCKNASNQPIKYLCKYFDIKINEETLANFENVLNNFAAVEQGKILLKNERDFILAGIRSAIPVLIFSISKNKLLKRLGFEVIDLSDLYFPVYTFQYVSAGGNSSTKCDIKLNIGNLDKLINYLNDLIKFRKSIEGQRALMTSNLREKIKLRDNFTCRKCGLSTHQEQNLLLEIDHIIPLSKGGITSIDNLQTLCWRCNRSKGSKLANT